MPRIRVTPTGLHQPAFGSLTPGQNICAEEAQLPCQDFGIDEYAALPWIGLHYRHEFLLHYSHELLEGQDLEG